MTDRLEAELRELGRHLDMPTAPDMTAAVRSRLARRPVPRRFVRPRWALALLVIVAVLLAGTPQGRAVVGHVLRFAGIEFRTEPAAPTPSGPGILPGGIRTTLEDARRRVDFPVLVPAALGRPDQVIISDQGRVASLVYAGQSIRLDEFDGTMDTTLFEKYVTVEPDRFRRTTVAGRSAVWIDGPHELLYVDRSGVRHSARTAGDTLVWQYGRVALRLEGVTDQDQARDIAESVR